MKVAYCLKDDRKHIELVQKATLTTDNFGIEPTNGLFGSPEWWDRITNGELPVTTFRGTITDRFMGSMGDWPMIRVLSDAGEKSEWTREVNHKEQDSLYRVGRRIEMRLRPPATSKQVFGKKEHEVVLEIRVEPDSEGDMPGVYENLLAKETAHRVLTAPVLLVMEASYQLAELGRTPGVIWPTMSSESLQMPVMNVIARGRSFPDNPEGRQEAARQIQELEVRWKDRIFAACQRIEGDQS